MGFINPRDFGRTDGAPIGMTVEDDIYVYLGVFMYMASSEYKKPSKLEVGMVIMFYIDPSTSKPGRLTAEHCTVVQSGSNK